MKALRYTQKEGFSSIKNIEAELSIKLPQSWGSTREALGRGWSPLEDIGRDLDDGPTVTIYEFDGLVGEDDESAEIYLAEMDNGDRIEWVLIKGNHDLIAFRCFALAPLIQMYTAAALLSVGSAASTRAFTHKYGHRPSRPCRQCETEDERFWRQERERKIRERKAQEAKQEEK